MTITLTPHQEKRLQRAIEAGVVRSVDDFIDTAIEALPIEEKFDRDNSALAVAGIRELRKVAPKGQPRELPSLHLGGVGSLRRSEILQGRD